MKRLTFVRTWLATLVAAAFIASFVRGETTDYVQLALKKPVEALERINSLPREERLDAIKALLASSEPGPRQMAARLARNAFDCRIIDKLQEVAKTAKKEAVAKDLQSAVDFLIAYRNIALPDAELAALAPPPAESRETLLKREGLGPVALKVTVQNAKGEAIGGAKVLAYSATYCLRVPSRGFAEADADGRATMDVAPGAWTILAFSPETYQKSHAGRGVFTVADGRKLERPTEELTIRPAGELSIAFEDAGEAAEVHILDGPLGADESFPSLGATKNGKFILEANPGHPLALLATGKRDKKTLWTAFVPELKSSDGVVLKPTGPQSASLLFTPPTHLRKVESAKVSIRQRAHDQTPATIEVKPGQTVFMTPGKAAIDYVVASSKAKYGYGPMEYSVAPGETRSLVLDSPSTASMYCEHKPNFYGKKNVLMGGLIAADANGHFLIALQGSKGGPAPMPVRILDGDKTIAAEKGEDIRIFRELADNVSSGIVPQLTYEIGADLGPGIPKTLRACGVSTYETAHFKVQGPAPLLAQLQAFGTGAERVYDGICRLYGQPPRWKKMGILVRPILPPTVGAQAVRGGVQFRTMALMQARWVEHESVGATAHELLHTFGFGHDDLMAVWCLEVLRDIRREAMPNAFMAVGAGNARAVLKCLRGEETDVALENLPWIIYARYGMRPFQGYQKVEKEWKAAMQANGLNDPESYCAVFSEMAGTDFSGLFGAAGLPVSDDAREKAKEIIASLRSGQTPAAMAKEPAGENAAMANAALATAEETRASSATSQESADPSPELNRLLMRAAQGGEGMVARLREGLPKVKEVPMNRTRVRMYMRFGDAFFKLDAKQDAYEAYKQAQREAARVSDRYLDMCRRFSVDALMGKPLMLGHM